MKAADWLDLPAWVGQRSATYRFVLIDGPTGIIRGEIHPVRQSVPSLEHDTGSTISRRVSGILLGAAESGLINPLRDRVKISMVAGDANGTEYPLGQYMVADDVTQQTTGGNLRPLTLFDEMFIVDQKLPTGFAAGGDLVDQAITRLVAGLPIGDLVIDGTIFASNGGWSAGVSRGTALTDLASSGGYFKPWFNHANQLRVLHAFEPANQVPDIDLDTPPRVKRDSIGRTNDLPTAQNRFVVVSNSTDAATAPIVGTYDVPSSAPFSIAQRGFVLPEVQDAQVASAAQATAYARTLGLQSTVYERVTLTTPPDPRHDGYNVILFDGLLWLEIAWSLPLVEGGAMTHTLRRAYPTTGEDDEVLT